MAQQLQKKFIGDNQVDGDKLLLEQGQSIRAKDSTSTEVDLIKLNVTDQLVIPSDVVVEGDLVVQGAITSIESATLQVTDANVVVNKDGTVASADSAGAGITVEMSDATDAAISFDSSLASKFKMGEIGAQAQVVTVSHTQTLSNKSIDADSNTISNLEVDNFKSGVLDTDLSSVSASDDTIASAKAVKSYVDTEVSSVQSELDATQSGAGLDSEGAYLPNGSANYISTATSLHQADQSLDSALKITSDALAQEITDRSNAVSAVADDVSHLVTLSGVAVDSDNLGSFSGATIPDDQTVKQALQALEIAIESVSGGGSSTQTELDNTQAGAGLDSNGNYLAPPGSTYIYGASSLKNADELLDAALTDVQSELDATQSGAGLEADGAYAAPVGSNYLGAATSLKDADSKLDVQLKTVADDLANHISDSSDAHDASAISFSAIGNISAADVQSAIEELDTEKVAKAGDTMTGTLTMDSGVGNTVNVYDQGVEVVSGGFVTNVYSGEVELGYSDGTISSSVVVDTSSVSISNSSAATGDSSSLQISVATNSSTISQVASDSVNQFNGQSDLSISSLDFSFLDQATGMQSTTSYQHNLISIQQNDGTNSSSFTVTPGVSVELLSNGVAVTPTADSHLAPKKYVDDEIAAQATAISDHLSDSVDAHDASAISFSPSGNIIATEVQAAIEELDSEKVKKSGDTMTGTLIINPASGNAAELSDLNIGVPSWGPNYLAIAMKDGSSKQFYAGTGDQLGAFAGVASKRVLLASGFTSGATSGLVQVTSGDAEVSGNSGMVDIFSGRALGGVSGVARLSSGLGSSSSGATQVLTGAAQNTGAVQIISGNASAGNSGNIQLSTGTATGTRGNILINAPEMSFQSLGKITNLQDAVSAQDAVTKSQLDAHINDASDSHDASSISLSPAINGQSDVQSALADHETRIDVLESVVWFKEKFSISNLQTSVTLSHVPEANSMSAFVDRLAIHEGPSDDYTISGTTMTFLNDLVAPGDSEIGAGDTVYVKYQYKV